MTKKEMFNEIIVVATENNRMDIVDFAKAEIELLNKRNSTESKAKKEKAEETARLSENIITAVSNATDPMRTMEIANEIGVSPQKATPILKALVAEGKLVVNEIKGKVKVYTVAV